MPKTMPTKLKVAMALVASCLFPFLAAAQYRPNPFTTNSTPSASNYVVQITHNVGALPLQAGSNIVIYSAGGSNIINATASGLGTDTNAVRILSGVSSNQTAANPVLIAPVVSGNMYVFGNQTNTGDVSVRDFVFRNGTGQSLTIPGPYTHYDSNGIVDLKSPTNNIPSVPIGAPFLSGGTNPTPTTKWGPAALGTAAYQNSSAFDPAGEAENVNSIGLVGYSSFQPSALGQWTWDQLVITTNTPGELTGTWYHDGNIAVMPWGGLLLTYAATTNAFTGNNYPHIGYRIANTIEGFQTTTNYGVFSNAPWGQRLNSKIKTFFGTMWMINYVGTNTAFEAAPLVGSLSYATNGNAAGVPLWHEVGVVVSNGPPGSYDQDKVYISDFNWVPGRGALGDWVISYYGCHSNDTYGGVSFVSSTNPYVASSWYKQNYITNNATINDVYCSSFMRFFPNIGWVAMRFADQLTTNSTYVCTNQWFTNWTPIAVYKSDAVGGFGDSASAIGQDTGGFFDHNGPALIGSSYINGDKLAIAHPVETRPITPSLVTAGAANVTGAFVGSGGGSFNGTNWGTNFYHPDGRNMFYPAGTNHILFVGAGDSSLNAEYSWSNSLNYYYDPLLGGHITNSASQWIIVNKGSDRYGKINSSSILGSDWTNINGSLPNPVTKSAMLAMLFHMSTNTVPVDTNNPVVYLSLTNSDGNVYRIKAYQ